MTHAKVPLQSTAVGGVNDPGEGGQKIFENSYDSTEQKNSEENPDTEKNAN